jgi:hypothetical protein
LKEEDGIDEVKSISEKGKMDDYFQQSDHDTHSEVSKYFDSIDISDVDNKIVRPPPEKQLADVNVLLEQNSNQPSDVIFLVDLKWWSAWELYASLKSTKEPGQIKNDNLVVSETSSSDPYIKCKFKLKQGIIEGRDFVRLPPEAWEALRSWYGGGPPLPRLLMNDTQELELWPAIIPSIESAMCGGETLRLHQTIPLEGAAIHRVKSFGFNDCGGAGNLPADTNVIRSQTASNSAPEQQKVCFVCKNQSTLRCSKCSAVNYCGRLCQTVHWKFHKKVSSCCLVLSL